MTNSKCPPCGRRRSVRQTGCRNPRPAARRDGVALVITLAFVVLLTGLIVAFFSRAMTVRQVSNASANRVEVSLFARGAVDEIVSDLKQEIRDTARSKEIATSNPATKIYVPKSPKNMVPERLGKGGGTLPTNIVKQSANGQAFYTDGPSRAAAVSTTTLSQNGKFISAARWNSPLFLPKADPASDWDLTPVTGSSGFTPPDWILVARDGSNPTSANGNAALTNNNFVVGRYAFNIYDEGGLLDMNAGGYPASIFQGLPADDPNASAPAYKNTLAFADLTLIPGIADLTDATRKQVISNIVGWRHFGSLNPYPSGTWPAFSFPSGDPAAAKKFASLLVSNTKGFLGVPYTATDPGSARRSDNILTSRQQLIQMFERGLTKDSAERAKLQNALQYLTHFTRDLNQPSLAHNTDMQKSNPILAPGAGGSSMGSPGAKKYEDMNPNFLAIRAPKGPYTNNDNSLSKFRASDGKEPVEGEPQVKYRFPLNRLAWLTPRGPIANDAGTALNPKNDPDVKKIIDQLRAAGFTDEFLMRGTKDNIRNSFGFLWEENSNYRRWKYRKSPTSPGPIATVVSASTGSSTREPDFVELVKAAYVTGALGKAASQPGAGGALHPYGMQNNFDYDADRHLMQIVANVIDQFDFDGYSTIISYDSGSGAGQIAGVENFPYVYRLRSGTLIARNPLPVLAKDGSTAPPVPKAGEQPQFDSGVGLFMQVPDLWNPHDESAPLGDPRPTRFRILVDSVDPKTLADGAVIGDYNKFAAWSESNWGSSAESKSSSNDTKYPFTLGVKGTGTVISYSALQPNRAIWSQGSSTNAAVKAIFTFKIDTSSTTSKLFREPTMMAKVGFPKIGSEDSDFKGPDLGSDPYLGSSVLTNSAGQPVYKNGGFVGDGANPVNPANYSNEPIAGVVAGIFPLRWVKSNKIYGGDQAHLRMSGGDDDAGGYVTYRLQYPLDPAKTGENDTWVTYDTKYSEIVSEFVLAAVTDKGTPTGGLIQSGGPYKDRPSPPAWPALVSTPGLATDGSDYNHFRDPGFAWQNWVDPRTSRFGAVTASHMVNNAHFAPGAFDKDWVDKGNLMTVSNRPDQDKGIPQSSKGRDSGIYPKNFYSLYRNQGFNMDSVSYWTGLLSQNNKDTSNTYFTDADGIMRRAMGAHVTGSPASTTIGLPMVKTMTSGGTSIADASRNRPYILNRPFRSVAELGYVFSDTPWRNLGLHTAESAASGLLDVFCLNDSTATGSPLVAGKVNLNTRQAPVLQAILAGAYKDDKNATGEVITAAEAKSISDAAAGFVKGTTTTPLMNLSNLVGTYTGGSGAAAKFEGPLDNIFGANNASANIERFRESAVRALANVGQTRVWNLMIDVIAQTGRYPARETNLDKFVVEGEQRYWVHVAIDRYTGEVLDKNLEVAE